MECVWRRRRRKAEWMGVNVKAVMTEKKKKKKRKMEKMLMAERNEQKWVVDVEWKMAGS